jgi:hypothetical protein
MAVAFEYTEPAASLGQSVDYKLAAADVEGDGMFVCPASRESDGYTALGKRVYRLMLCYTYGACCRITLLA